jgi:hypothetical protein
MWTVWCDNISKRRVDEDTFVDFAVKVGKSDNIQKLRSLCHAADKQVLSEDRSTEISSMRVFNDTIQPHISDPRNINGGCMTVSIPASHWTMCYFFNVLALLWAYDFSFSRFLNGIVLTRAVAMWHLSIWHSGDITDDAKHELANQLRLQTNCSECTFSVHNKPKASAKSCVAKHVLLDTTESAKTMQRGPLAFDYDKEMKLISSKYPRIKNGFVRCDMCTLIGTVIITLILTAFRILSGNFFLVTSF